jgi:hypothetical protein
MNEDTGKDKNVPRGKDDLESLFHLAGRRPKLPDREVERIKKEAREAWRLQVRRMARRRRAAWLGAAAATGVLLAAGLVLRGRPGPPEPAGTLGMRLGDVLVKGNRASLPGALSSGTIVETSGRGRAALRLASTSVRLDVGSAVRLDSAHELTLQRGAVYVDSGRTLPGSSSIEISTALGSVRHTGTQFEVRYFPAGALRVRVREGTVLVDHGEVYETRAGEELTLRSDGEVRRSPVPNHGLAWDWIQRTAPPLAIEGMPLAVFLDWVSRETGRLWRYSDPALEQAAQDVILHGSIAGLTPEEALSIVLPGCGFRYRRAAEALLLERDDTP